MSDIGECAARMCDMKHGGEVPAGVGLRRARNPLGFAGLASLGCLLLLIFGSCYMCARNQPSAVQQPQQ